MRTMKTAGGAYRIFFWRIGLLCALAAPMVVGCGASTNRLFYNADGGGGGGDGGGGDMAVQSADPICDPASIELILQRV